MSSKLCIIYNALRAPHGPFPARAKGENHIVPAIRSGKELDELHKFQNTLVRTIKALKSAGASTRETSLDFMAALSKAPSLLRCDKNTMMEAYGLKSSDLTMLLFFPRQRGLTAARQIDILTDLRKEAKNMMSCLSSSPRYLKTTLHTHNSGEYRMDYFFSARSTELAPKQKPE